MKKLFIATLLLSSASLSHASHKLVSADGSSLSELCIAATTASGSLPVLALDYGIAPSELDTIRCNGQPLKRFVARYKAPLPTSAASETVAGYVLRKADTSALTELCAAAAVSESEFEKVKSLHFNSEPRIESELFCNGKPLKSFVRKFRAARGVELSQR